LIHGLRHEVFNLQEVRFLVCWRALELDGCDSKGACVYGHKTQ
jgi:hypothetical protein